jgi:hypothetical protein
MRRPHVERRPTIDEAYATYFRERMNSLRDDYPPGLVLNKDETCWRLYEAPRRVLEEKGKETVKLCSHKSEKRRVLHLEGLRAVGISCLCG